MRTNCDHGCHPVTSEVVGNLVGQANPLDVRYSLLR